MSSRLTRPPPLRGVPGPLTPPRTLEELKAVMRERQVVTGEDIKSIRAYLNLSQDEFREALGVTLSTVKGWERQKRVSRRVQVMVRGLLWEMVLRKMFES